MTLQQLEAYVTVCETNNFSKAAKQLNMYPSNLSYTITEFETSLDVILLNRSKKGVYPNFLGKEVYKQAKDILELVANCAENINTIQQSGKSLTVAYSRQFSVAKFQTKLRLLSTDLEKDGISLNLIIPNDETMALKALHNRNADIAILYEDTLSTFPDYDNYETVFLENDPVYVALSRSHPLSKKEMLTLDDIKEETILLCNDGNLWDTYAKTLFSYSNISPQKFTCCYNYLVQRELILQHTQYLSIVSSFFADSADSSICYIPLKHPLNQRKICAFYSKSEEKESLSARAVVSLI